MSSPGEWLEKALLDLCRKMETGLESEADVISLVSYCECAPPQDAREYLNNIIGQEAGQTVIEEYLQRRGLSSSTQNVQNSKFQAYMKPAADSGLVGNTKKQAKAPKEATLSGNQDTKNPPDAVESKSGIKGNQNVSKKKKAGKSISLAEAAKGSIVFQQGKPCSCQARRHRLVSNCLSCGKIVCEQEGEGPCSFCGALVLRECSTYAGLENTAVPLSDAEAAADAYAKRLVDYDRNSAARTTVIDDQSDYYETEGSSWLSPEEKELLVKKRQEMEEAERARRSKVVMTFDLVGRKVLLNEDEATQLETDSRILRPLEEREANRIKPNPTIKVQPVFIDLGLGRKMDKGKQDMRTMHRGKQNMKTSTGLCLEISGRVQHNAEELQHLMVDGQQGFVSYSSSWQTPAVKSNVHDYTCKPDYD